MQGSDTIKENSQFNSPDGAISSLAHWNMWNENGYFSLVLWTLKLLALIPINGGPSERKSKRRKGFQFLTWSLPDVVLLFEWIGFLCFCWSIVWRRKTHDSKCFLLWTYTWFHLCFYTLFFSNQFPCSWTPSNK